MKGIIATCSYVIVNFNVLTMFDLSMAKRYLWNQFDFFGNRLGSR